jgi:hypothetical protein
MNCANSLTRNFREAEANLLILFIKILIQPFCSLRGQLHEHFLLLQLIPFASETEDRGQSSRREDVKIAPGGAQRNPGKPFQPNRGAP